MKFNELRNLVLPQLVLFLFTCYWKFVIGDFEYGHFEVEKTVKKFDMVIGGYVYDRVVDLDKRINDIISACNSKLKSEYKDCAICVNKCSFHTTHKIPTDLTAILPINNMHFPSKLVPVNPNREGALMANIGLNFENFSNSIYNASRWRRGRVSFRGPRFGRGWGKKRDVQKAVRDMKCSCTMCGPFQKVVSKTETTNRVCGSNFFSKKEKLIKERNDAFNVYKFTTNNQFVNKIFMDLGSLKRINNEFYLTNSIIMFSTPNGSELSVKMTKGMPLFGLTPLNTIEVARLEGPKLFALLKKNS